MFDRRAVFRSTVNRHDFIHTYLKYLWVKLGFLGNGFFGVWLISFKTETNKKQPLESQEQTTTENSKIKAFADHWKTVQNLKNLQIERLGCA